MEEASIILAKRAGTDTSIPIYVDGTPLPADLLDPKQTNYFASGNPVAIAAHLATRCRPSEPPAPPASQDFGGMHICGNQAGKQVFIDKLEGTLNV